MLIFCPWICGENKAAQDKAARDRLVAPLPARLKKEIFAIRLRIEWMVQRYGMEHIGLGIREFAGLAGAGRIA